jgi:hypothetical protein
VTVYINFDQIQIVLLARLSMRKVASASKRASLNASNDLDRGTTEALIAKGFIEELIQRESTNIEPSTLVDILRDQEAAIYLVQDLVAKARPFTRGALLELYSILTRHQPTTIAVDHLSLGVESDESS